MSDLEREVTLNGLLKPIQEDILFDLDLLTYRIFPRTPILFYISPTIT